MHKSILVIPFLLSAGSAAGQPAAAPAQGIALYSYGYRNVYELGPNLSVRSTRIPFEGTWVESIRSPVN